MDDVPSSSGEQVGNSMLREGRHRITLQVEDTTGPVDTDTVVVNVGPPDGAPAGSLNQPLNNDSFHVGPTILFRGTANDLDQDATGLSVGRSSDLDGVLSTGAPTRTGAIGFGFGSLSTATHTITLRVRSVGSARGWTARTTSST